MTKPGQMPLMESDTPTCAWNWEGDFCMRKVETPGSLCDHHAKEALRLNVNVPVNGEVESVTPASAPKAAPARTKKKTPKKKATKRKTTKKVSEDPPRGANKYERLKAIARRSVRTLLLEGQERGLSADEVVLLNEALDALGLLHEGGDQ